MMIMISVKQLWENLSLGTFTIVAMVLGDQQWGFLEER